MAILKLIHLVFLTPNRHKQCKVDKTTISSEVSFDKKGCNYFVSDKDHEKVKLLCIMLPKMSGYAKSFDETT